MSASGSLALMLVLPEWHGGWWRSGDTAHFKYNASAEVALSGSAQDPHPPADSPSWRPLLGRTRLQPDTRHEFPSQCDQPVATVRLDAFPDGGLSRVRLIGRITPDARRAAGYRWFNTLPAPQAIQCLVTADLDAGHAADLARRRPLTGLPDHGARQALTRMLEGNVSPGS